MANFDIDIIAKVHATLKSKGKKLALAESCTGGLVAHMLTSEAGASEFLHSCIVAYSASAKQKLLHFKGKILDEHGTVSEEAARHMVEQALTITGADVALSITGNAGPEPIENKRVGMIYIAAATLGQTSSRGFIFDGSRQEINQQAANKALHFLYESINIWD